MEWQTIATTLLSGLVSGLSLLIAVKTDVAWIKDELKRMDKRIERLEDT